VAALGPTGAESLVSAYVTPAPPARRIETR
jgi:hypothetical protein